METIHAYILTPTYFCDIIIKVFDYLCYVFDVLQDLLQIRSYVYAEEPNIDIHNFIGTFTRVSVKVFRTTVPIHVNPHFSCWKFCLKFLVHCSNYLLTFLYCHHHLFGFSCTYIIKRLIIHKYNFLKACCLNLHYMWWFNKIFHKCSFKIYHYNDVMCRKCSALVLNCWAGCQSSQSAFHSAANTDHQEFVLISQGNSTVTSEWVNDVSPVQDVCYFLPAGWRFA